MKSISKNLILICLLLNNNLHADKKIDVAIQPLGSLRNDLIEKVKSGILHLYNVYIVILPAIKLPQNAFYKPRNRYRADILLEYLDNDNYEKYQKVLGLTAKDISTTKGSNYDWGIFGYGSVGGRPCVVSTFRLRRDKATEMKFFDSLIKVVNHELGHTFGLNHCPNNGCLMQDAEGTIQTVDNESGKFCRKCRNNLKDLLN